MANPTVTSPSTRIRSRRRARACLLWTAVAFVACQAAFGAFVWQWHPEWRDPRYGKIEAELRKRQIPDSALVVMLGSSRTHSGFRAGDLEKPLSKEHGRPVTVANFGVSGGGPFAELLTLRRLLHDGHRPDLVLLDITPPFLNSSVPFGEIDEDRLPPGRLRPFELPLVARYRGTSVVQEWGRWLAASAVPCVTYRTEMMATLWPSTIPEKLKEPAADNYGWLELISNPAPSHVKYRAQVTRRIYTPGLKYFALGGPNLQALYELLDLLKSEGIPTVVVMSCEAPEFQELYRPEAEAQITSLMQDIQTKYGFPQVNARSWFPAKRFMDLHHLNPDTAREYTRRLSREAIVPQLSNNAMGIMATRDGGTMR